MPNNKNTGDKSKDINDLLEFLLKAKKPALLMHPDLKNKLPKGSTTMPFKGIPIIVSEYADRESLTGMDMQFMKPSKFSPSTPVFHE